MHSKYFMLFNCDRSASSTLCRHFYVASNCYHRLKAASAVQNQILTRWISTTNIRHKCLYTLLNVNKDATQADIKNAYYELSKLFHPDKNGGNENAAEKFRNISDAYEILGDVDKRRLYDQNNLRQQSIIYDSAGAAGFRPDDDAQTRFYKQHMRRSSRPTMTGRSNIYDYDEWTKNHYTNLFNKKQEEKRRRNYECVFERSHSAGMAGHQVGTFPYILFFIISSSLIFLLLKEIMIYDNHDKNKTLENPSRND